MKKQITAFILLIILTVSFFACSKKGGNPMQSNEQDFTLSLISGSLDRESIFTNRDVSAKYDDSVFSIKLKDNASSSDNDKVVIKNNIINITSSGTYIISGKLNDGQIRINADKKDKIQLVLNGVNIVNTTSPAINIIRAKKVFITSPESSSNYLSVTEEFVKDENNADGVIYSKQDLTLNGGGELSVNASYSHGVVCNDDLVITGGKYVITAGKHSIKANDSISISDGEFDLTATKDALHCDNDDDADKGNIFIQNADFNISVQDDAVHASGYFVMDSGNINIENSYEGIEAHFIEINGGSVNLKSSDDGLNATSGSSAQENTTSNAGMDMRNPFDSDESCYINIAGGDVTIDADGDGLDSNGYIQQTGGIVIVYGAENSGDSALDYGASAKITGGSIIAFGYSGMAQGFGSFSTQGSMLINFDNESTENFFLKDKKGNTIVSQSAQKKYNSVVVSTQDILKGKKYKAYAGSQRKTIKMKKITYSDTNNEMDRGGNKLPNEDMQKGEPPKGELPGGNTPNGNAPDNKGETPPDNTGNFDNMDLPQGSPPQMPG